MSRVPQCGVAWIDADHRAIQDLFETVRAAALDGRWRNAKAAHKVLVRLLEEHFRKEEALMRRYGHVGAAAHAAGHRRILTDVASVYSMLSERSSGTVIEELLRAIEAKGRHMAEHDIDLVRDLLRQGYDGRDVVAELA